MNNHFPCRPRRPATLPPASRCSAPRPTAPPTTSATPTVGCARRRCVPAAEPGRTLQSCQLQPCQHAAPCALSVCTARYWSVCAAWRGTAESNPAGEASPILSPLLARRPHRRVPALHQGGVGREGGAAAARARGARAAGRRLHLRQLQVRGAGLERGETREEESLAPCFTPARLCTCVNEVWAKWAGLGAAVCSQCVPALLQHRSAWWTA